jgi:hypothetical protein
MSEYLRGFKAKLPKDASPDSAKKMHIAHVRMSGDLDAWPQTTVRSCPPP